MDLKLKQAETRVPLIPELSERWSPRAFAEKKVEQEKLLALFEAARWAASSSNEQPWNFIVAQKGDEHYDKLFEGLVSGNQKWAWTAPVLVATLARKRLQKREGKNKHAWHDLGLAMGNLSAQATAMGLHIHQMAGIKPDTVAENFAVDTDEFDVATMFVVGYQSDERVNELSENHAKAEEKGRERKPLKELLHARKFGQQPDWLD